MCIAQVVELCREEVADAAARARRWRFLACVFATLSGILMMGAARATPVYDCPAEGAAPLYLPPTCPAPHAGLLYGLHHADVDREAAKVLRENAAQLDIDAARLAERADDLPAWVWAAGGLLLGGAAVWVYDRER